MGCGRSILFTNLNVQTAHIEASSLPQHIYAYILEFANMNACVHAWMYLALQPESYTIVCLYVLPQQTAPRSETVADPIGSGNSTA